jgi:hypothetical protein
MARGEKYTSRWVVDRKFWTTPTGEGQTWFARYTACSRPYCKKCRGSASNPGHGPYWTYYSEVDGRNHIRHHSVYEPLPWGDNPPPSVMPSAVDPNSRLGRKRAAREARARAEADAKVERQRDAEAKRAAAAVLAGQKLQQMLVDAQARLVQLQAAHAVAMEGSRKEAQLAAAVRKLEARVGDLLDRARAHVP